MPRRPHTLSDCTTLPLPLTAPTPAPALLSAGTLVTANAQGSHRPATDDEILYNRHRVIEFVPLFRGTVDGASVYPREVVKKARARNAAAVILAHNHPSGVAEPSAADELITSRVKDALSLIDVRVLDHMVVTGDAIVSFADRGLL